MKRIKLILFVIGALTIIVLCIVVMSIINKPERMLHRKLGLELLDSESIKRSSCYLKDFAIHYAYEIYFCEDVYDSFMERLLKTTGDRELFNFCEGMTQTAKEGKGVPYGKYWLNTETEKILCWYEKLDSTRIVVSQDSSGMYHVYIEWEWTPFDHMTT